MEENWLISWPNGSYVDVAPQDQDSSGSGSGEQAQQMPFMAINAERQYFNQQKSTYEDSGDENEYQDQEGDYNDDCGITDRQNYSALSNQDYIMNQQADSSTFEGPGPGRCYDAATKRREKARIAARARRSQEAGIITEMANELMISRDRMRRIDKATIVKLAIDYIKASQFLTTGSTPNTSNLMDAVADEENDQSTASVITSSGLLQQQHQDYSNCYEQDENDHQHQVYTPQQKVNVSDIDQQQQQQQPQQYTILSTNNSSNMIVTHQLGQKSFEQEAEVEQKETINRQLMTSSTISNHHHHHYQLGLQNIDINSTTNIDHQQEAENEVRRNFQIGQKQSNVSNKNSTIIKVSEPILSTNSIFSPRTPNMDSHYLMISERDDGKSSFVLKLESEIEEEDDLTHLAPQAGDMSIPLEVEPLDGIELDQSNLLSLMSTSPPTKKLAPFKNRRQVTQPKQPNNILTTCPITTRTTTTTIVPSLISPSHPIYRHHQQHEQHMMQLQRAGGGDGAGGGGQTKRSSTLHKIRSISMDNNNHNYNRNTSSSNSTSNNNNHNNNGSKLSHQQQQQVVAEPTVDLARPAAVSAPRSTFVMGKQQPRLMRYRPGEQQQFHQHRQEPIQEHQQQLVNNDLMYGSYTANIRNQRLLYWSDAI